MRVMLLAVVVCVALAPVHAQEGESQTVLDKAIKAHGGEAAVQKLTASTSSAKGKLHIMELDVDLTIQTWTQKPDKVKSLLNLSIMGQDMEIVQVFNGKKGWMNIMGELKDLSDEELTKAEESLHVDRVTGLYGLKGDKDIKLSPLGEVKVGDKAAVGIMVKKDGKRDVKLYFDKNSYLLIKAEYRGHDPITGMEVTQSKLFTEYKEFVPGVKSASKMSMFNDGDPFMELDVINATFVEKHDDSIFAKPGKLPAPR